MRETKVSLPELGLIASTRVLLGIGIGLLIARRMDQEVRKAVGISLTLIGSLATIPLGFEVLSHGRIAEQKPSEEASAA